MGDHPLCGLAVSRVGMLWVTSCCVIISGWYCCVNQVSYLPINIFIR